MSLAQDIHMKNADDNTRANAAPAGTSNARLDFVSKSPSHLLHRAGQHAEDLFTRSIGTLGLTARQYAVLTVVDNLESPSQTALCDATGIDRSTIADIVRRLVTRGLVARRRTAQDARMYAVRLTPEGKNALETAVPIAHGVDAALLECLSPSEREAFCSLLEKVAHAPARDPRD